MWVGPEEITLFIVRDYTKRIVEIRTASSNSPDTLRSSVAEYEFSDFKHSTTFLDHETNTWFMYYLNHTGDAIRVKTSSVSVRNS